MRDEHIHAQWGPVIDRSGLNRHTRGRGRSRQAQQGMRCACTRDQRDRHATLSCLESIERPADRPYHPEQEQPNLPCRCLLRPPLAAAEQATKKPRAPQKSSS